MPKGKRSFIFGRLKKTESALYSRETASSDAPEEVPTSSVSSNETVPSEPASSIPSDWQEEISETPLTLSPRQRFITINHALVKKILLIAIGFFVVSVAFGSFIFLGGVNSVSTDNVDIVITGPSSIGAGEVLSFEVSVENNNNVALEGVNLLIEYPDSTRSAEDGLTKHPRDLEKIDLIETGGSAFRSKQAMLFGEADTTQHVIVSIEYRVKDSSATYFKEKYYDVIISTSPVRMIVGVTEEAVSGNEIELSIEIVSNSSAVVSGLALKVDYPFGFSYSAASPLPAYGNNIFALGDLNPSDRRVITIRGTLTGQENESRLFRITLGLPDKGDARQIGTVYLSSTKSITIKRPFVSATLTLNGSSNQTFAARPGEIITGEIAWANNLGSRIIDLEIQAKLTGDSLNRFSILPGNGGFYRSLDDVIVWDKTTSNAFTVIEPGQSGVVTFRFSPQSVSSLLYSGARGHEIGIDISIRARRLSDVTSSEQISSGESKKVRLSSDLTLVGKSLFYTGVFPNQGFIPPKVERSTTYTIVWSVANTLNNVSGARVEAVLPGYVDWVGTVSPSGSSLTYDPATRRVIWDIGDILPATGFSNPPREVAFQISFVPSISQIGDTPAIVRESVLTGVDRYTNATLKATAKEITTQISDGTQGREQGIVVQ